MFTTKTSVKFAQNLASPYHNGGSHFPIFQEETLTQFIKSLFSDGTQGLYINPQDALSVSDLSSIKDLSGNNNHALQADSSKRATLITNTSGYNALNFDGIDDSYVTSSIDFSRTDKVTVIVAARRPRETAQYECLLNCGLSGSNGSFALMLSSAYTSSSFEGKGTLARYAVSAPYTVPKNQVLTGVSDLSGNKTILRLSGNKTEVTTSLGGGNFSNTPIYIGRRDGTSQSAFTQISALLVIGKLLDDATIQRIEKAFAKYIGVSL